MYLKLPATSANLGPGFDAVGLAMSLYLTIEAEPSSEFRIEASGRNAALCANVDTSLILTTYRDLLGARAPALFLKLDNEIPLGMGCGSSAAALLAGVLLANHFGELGWTDQRVLEEACRREGHPDNVAACFQGGMTCSADDGNRVIAATCGQDLKWNLMLALPSSSLATEKARALLPSAYSRADAVANVQSVALLVAAFALDKPELLRTAMRDRLHQPYRMEACPLLPKLLPLIDAPEVFGVALSGAGPSVLLIVSAEGNLAELKERVRQAAGDPMLEVVAARIAGGATVERGAAVGGTAAGVGTMLPGDLGLDHVGIAVRSIGAALGFYESLGLTVGAVETVDREQVRVAMMALGETRLELLEATAEDSVIGRFVARRGEGLHHIAVRVADVDATFARLTGKGVRLASEAVGVGAGGHRYFFVHPASTGGVLVEVVGGRCDSC